MYPSASLAFSISSMNKQYSPRHEDDAHRRRNMGMTVRVLPEINSSPAMVFYTPSRASLVIRVMYTQSRALFVNHIIFTSHCCLEQRGTNSGTSTISAKPRRPDDEACFCFLSVEHMRACLSIPRERDGDRPASSYIGYRPPIASMASNHLEVGRSKLGYAYLSHRSRCRCRG